MSGRRPSKRPRTGPSARARHLNGEHDVDRACFPMQYRIGCVVGRRWQGEYAASSPWSLCSSPSWSSSCRLDLRLDLHRDLRVDKGEDQKQDKRKRRSDSSSRKAAERQQQRKQKKNVCCRRTGRCGQQGRYDRGFRRDIHTKFSCLRALLLLYFACALSVLLVCFFAANAQGAQTKVQIPDLCKEYVHNM